MAIEVLTSGPSSRSEIARRLGMSGGSLTRLAKPLIDSGLLLEVVAPSGPDAVVGQGRPGQPLDIVTDAWHFVGLKVTGDTVYGVVTTLKSTVVRREDRTLESQDPEAVVDAAHSIVRSFAVGFPQLAGIGVGMGGPVRDRAVVVDSPFLDWQEVPFAEMLERRTDLPVVVENDFAALVEAETWFGAGRGLDRFAVLTIGAGIGYGLVIGGEPVPSAGPLAGDGGPLDPRPERAADTPREARQRHVPAVHPEHRVPDARRHRPPRRLRGDPRPRRASSTLRPPASSTRPPADWGSSSPRSRTSPCRRRSCSPAKAWGLMDVAGSTVHDTVTEHRPPLAPPVNLETKVSDFHDWARGAAVLAIQVLVLGHTED